MTADALDPAAVERERAVLAEQAKNSGKPAEIVSKMVEGGLRKYYEAWVLPEQVWVIDNKSRVKQVIDAAGKELGTPVKIGGFVRFALGEGIDKEAKDAAQ
jgi:elongation factor Ts